MLTAGKQMGPMAHTTKHPAVVRAACQLGRSRYISIDDGDGEDEHDDDEDEDDDDEDEDGDGEDEDDDDEDDDGDGEDEDDDGEDEDGDAEDEDDDDIRGRYLDSRLAPSHSIAGLVLLQQKRSSAGEMNTAR